MHKHQYIHTYTEMQMRYHRVVQTHHIPSSKSLHSNMMMNAISIVFAEEFASQSVSQ